MITPSYDKSVLSYSVDFYETFEWPEGSGTDITVAFVQVLAYRFVSTFFKRHRVSYYSGDELIRVKGQDPTWTNDVNFVNQEGTNYRAGFAIQFTEYYADATKAVMEIEVGQGNDTETYTVTVNRILS